MALILTYSKRLGNPKTDEYALFPQKPPLTYRMAEHSTPITRLAPDTYNAMSPIAAKNAEKAPKPRTQIITPPRKGLTMSTLVLSPVADTYIQQRQPSTNLVKRNRLVVGAERQPKNVYRSLLTFELSQLPPDCEIVDAALKLFVERATLSSCISVEAYGITPDYDATAVTWDTAPQATVSPAAFTVNYCQARQFIEADVSELVRNRRTDGDSALLGILLTEADGDAGSVVFAAGSDRDARYRPSLIIQYACGDSEAHAAQLATSQAEADAAAPQAYGGLYHDAEERIMIPENGVQPVALGETMPHRSMTPGANSLTADVAGDYAVHFMISLHASADAFPISAGVLINGLMSNPALRVFGEWAGSYTAMAGSAIVTLAAGDVLSLSLTSVSGGSAVLGPGLHASLTATRLS